MNGINNKKETHKIKIKYTLIKLYEKILSGGNLLFFAFYAL
jgi:hypothetical protein